jgi:hypothetical protein
MKEGFWGNYETGTWFRIDEHEQWLRTPGNAAKLGVPEEAAAEFAQHQSREELLPFVYRRAPVMRWRCHGASVTFEFDSEEWARPLELIHKWGRAFAGDCLQFHMVNFRTMEVRDALWRDLRPEAASGRADDLYMVRPQHELLARFRDSEGVCLIAAPVWKGVPEVKLYQLDGMDRKGGRTKLLFAENRNGSPGFAKAQLDKTLASPFLFLSERRPRIVRERQVIATFPSCAEALDAYLPQGFLPVVTRRGQALEAVLEALKKDLDRRRDREIDAEILRLECVIIPDWRMWCGKGDPERMNRMLNAKLSRLGCGIRRLPGWGTLVANTEDDSEFFAQAADFAAFAGAPMLLHKRKDRDELEKLDLAGGECHAIPGDNFRRYVWRVDYEAGRGFLRDKSRYDLRMAAAHALGLDLFRYRNIFGKMACDCEAKKFDGLRLRAAGAQTTE